MRRMICLGSIGGFALIAVLGSVVDAYVYNHHCSLQGGHQDPAPWEVLKLMAFFIVPASIPAIVVTNGRFRAVYQIDFVLFFAASMCVLGAALPPAECFTMGGNTPMPGWPLLLAAIMGCLLVVNYVCLAAEVVTRVKGRLTKDG